MNENNNDAPHRAGAKKGPRFCFTECLAFYICRKRIRDTEMARHRHRAIFTFAESGFRFRYAFAELLSANVAKERSDAEQPGEAVSRIRRTAADAAEGKELATRSAIVDAAAATQMRGVPEPVG